MGRGKAVVGGRKREEQERRKSVSGIGIGDMLVLVVERS
jgi:hypothetical protein